MTSQGLDIHLFGSQHNIDFLESRMWLDLAHIENKILNDSPLDKDIFTDIFNFMTQNFDKLTEGCESNFGEDARDKIVNAFHKINYDKYYNILDPLRKLYEDFCCGGIVRAYQGIDAEYWYPKIIFRERIESDISELPEKITLYRGTDINEYHSRTYGQSWSLSCETAEEFAYKHYNMNFNVKTLLLKEWY